MHQGKRFAVLSDGSEAVPAVELLLSDSAVNAGDPGVTKQGALPWLWHYSPRERDWIGPRLRDEDGHTYRVVEVDYKNNRIRLFER